MTYKCMKKLKLLAWVGYLALVPVAASCSDDEKDDLQSQLYTVTVTATDNGTAVADPATCEAGETVTLTATPDEGYLFVKWTVVSGEVTLADATVNPFKITMPNGDVAIEASFAEKIIPYAIRVVAGENGSVKAMAGEQEVTEAPEGTAVTLTATPDEGYEFVAWTLTGVEIAGEDLLKNPLTITMPAAEVNAEASFKLQIDVLEMITDPTFKAYVQHCMESATECVVEGETVKQPMWDTDLNGKLSEKEAAAVQFIDLNHFYNETAGELGLSLEEIKSLDGIGYFTGMKRLDIADYTIGYDPLELDLTPCSELVELMAEDCGDGLTKVILGEKSKLKMANLTACWGVTAIDLDKCPNLEELRIMSDYLTQVDLSKCPKLKKLTLQLYETESFDLSANKELASLDLQGCSELKSLDISHLTKLTYLSCTGCKLTKVDISKMAFDADGTYTAYVGNQGSPRNPLDLEELIMRADQKKHWDEVLTVGTANSSRNSRIQKVTVTE